MVKWKYIGSLLRLYIYVQSVKTYNWIAHEYECLFLAFIPFQIERESGKQNLGVKEKCPQSYLSYFFDGVPLENFLLSRAIRLCSVFSTGLKDFGVPRVSVNLLSLARSKMAMVRLPRALPKNSLFSYLLPLRRREPHFRFGVPANHLASLSFPFRCPATWGHLSANIWSPLWPTFLPNGHFLTAWYSHSIREDSISLTSSSPWAITWQEVHHRPEIIIL